MLNVMEEGRSSLYDFRKSGVAAARLRPYARVKKALECERQVKGIRKPFVNGPASGTGEEKVAAFDNYIAYYGTYTLDLKAQTITHHLEDASQPNWRGVLNVRWFEFQGNHRLLLIPREDGKGGVIDRKSATYKLLWERIK